MEQLAALIAGISSALGSIVVIWKYLIKRRKQLWAYFLSWRRGHREDKIDKVNRSRNSKSMGNIMRDILEKRNKRHKTS